MTGMPVLRTEMTNTREFNPRAFTVYGPKIVATRGHYQDRALESRFITEEMGARALRSDIPISLTESYQAEALQLRNKLLLYRFRNHGKKRIYPHLCDDRIEPRLRQIFAPLLSVAASEQVRQDLGSVARSLNADLIADRGLDVEADVLAIIHQLLARPDARQIAVKDITTALQERYGADYERAITSKWVGGILRRRLQLRTQKSNGVYVIPVTQRPRLDRLFEKYGLGDVPTDTDRAA
jgi:hypothetical protein